MNNEFYITSKIIDASSFFDMTNKSLEMDYIEGEFYEITIEIQFYRSLFQQITHHQWLEDNPDIDNIPK